MQIAVLLKVRYKSTRWYVPRNIVHVAQFSHNLNIGLEYVYYIILYNINIQGLRQA
jgi:hypothetical protein